MTRCPLCGSKLEPRYEIECASAITGLWKRRLRCASPDCGAAGLHNPATARWISFDELATGRQVPRGTRASGNGDRSGRRQGSA